MKVMAGTKHIRSGDKNAGPLRLWAGRLLAFLGAGDAMTKGPAAGVGGAVGGVQGSGEMVCRGWMGRAMIRRRSAAAIRRYLISH